MKETLESKSRVNCSGLARGPRSSGERNIGRVGPTQTSYNGILAYCMLLVFYLCMADVVVKFGGAYF